MNFDRITSAKANHDNLNSARNIDSSAPRLNHPRPGFHLSSLSAVIAIAVLISLFYLPSSSATTHRSKSPARHLSIPTSASTSIYTPTPGFIPDSTSATALITVPTPAPFSFLCPSSAALPAPCPAFSLSSAPSPELALSGAPVPSPTLTQASASPTQRTTSPRSSNSGANAQNVYTVSSGGFELEFSDRGLATLRRTSDLYPTNYILANNPLGDVIVTYRLAGENEYRHLRQAKLMAPGQVNSAHLVTSAANTAPTPFDTAASISPAAPTISSNQAVSPLSASSLSLVASSFTSAASTTNAPAPPLPLPSSPASSPQATPTQTFTYRLNPPYVPFIAGVKVSASTLSDRDARSSARALSALYDDLPIVDSKSRSGGYFSFNPKKGTVEWVQYDFPQPASATAIEVYWLDDSALNGPYKVPVRWRLLYRDARGNYLPVKNTSPYTTALDRFNRVTFEPVTTSSLRLEVEQAPGYTAGLYEWRVETDQEKLRRQAWEKEADEAARQIRVESSFKVANALLWTVSVENLTDRPLEIADLGLPLPFNTQYGWNKDETYNLRVIRHFLVAGHGSFVFCQRTNAEPPYLLMIPTGQAAFEYFDDGGGRGILCPYLHASWAFEQVKKEGGRWRFQTTSVELSPHGQPGDRLSYTFKFMWAEDGYQSVRDLLYEEGKFDIQVVPGMVVPENLEALVAIRTKHQDIRLEAEYPSETTIEEVKPVKNFGQVAAIKKIKGDKAGEGVDKRGRVTQSSQIVSETDGVGGGAANRDGADVRTDGSYRLFRIKFSRLGENIVTIKYGSSGAEKIDDMAKTAEGDSSGSPDLRSARAGGADSAATIYTVSDSPTSCVPTTGASYVATISGSKHNQAADSTNAITDGLPDHLVASGSMPLEFFVTEDLETVIKKRSSFLTTRQQHKDPSKWYYGVYSDWDMKNRVLRSPEDRDGLPTWLVDACDDAGNARPAFVASKNVYFPEQAEVASVDLYIKHYLWGGMQQADDEPYPFAIYGIPNWKVNRESPDPGRNGQKHIWRIYDYPHIVLLYHRMYQVARLHPEIKTELTAEEYLRRAYRTAIAYFTVPLEVEGWSAYETPTMNEIVMNDLLRALEREGWKKEEAELRRHWEKKVRHFVEDDPYLFGSEFAFDSTGFEATGAMARYAMEKVVEAEEELKRKEERKLRPGGEGGNKGAEFKNLEKTEDEVKSPGEGLIGTTTSREIAPAKKVQRSSMTGTEPVVVAAATGLGKMAIAAEITRSVRLAGVAELITGAGLSGVPSEVERNELIEGVDDGSDACTVERTDVADDADVVKEAEQGDRVRKGVRPAGGKAAARGARIEGAEATPSWRPAGEARAELQSEKGAGAEVSWERARVKVEKFMEKQLRLNVAARGWLETAYYYLGSDYRAGGGLRYTLSYMSQMGGWSIMDYALNWAGTQLFDYLRLGYASYLSSWALVNSGRAETGYGYWFPASENDGGAGGGFEPMARARGWLGKWIERGAWYYSAEEDVGYCGAIRTAATVVANDPVFGLVALGGKLEDKGDRIEVVPRDGLRVRFHLMASPERRLHVEFEKGRLAKEKAVVIKRDLSEIILQVEAGGEDGRAKIDGTKMAEVELVVSGLGLGLEYKAYDRAGQEIRAERLADGSTRLHSPSTDLVVLKMGT